MSAFNERVKKIRYIPSFTISPPFANTTPPTLPLSKLLNELCLPGTLNANSQEIWV